MINEKGKLINFITFPKEIIDSYYQDGKITIKGVLVMLWLYKLINPVNYFAIVSYEQLEKELGGFVTRDYLRKIFSKLKSLDLIYYKDNKGSKKPMKVWVYEYVRKGSVIISIEEIKKLQNKPQDREQLLSTFHKSEVKKGHIDTSQNQSSQDASITSSYTDTEIETKTDIYTDKQFNNKLNESNPSSGLTPIGNVIARNKKIAKDYTTHRCKDGTEAFMKFGKWVKKGTDIKLGYDPYLKELKEVFDWDEYLVS